MPKSDGDSRRPRGPGPGRGHLAMPTGHKQNANGAYPSYSCVRLLNLKPLIALFFPLAIKMRCVYIRCRVEFEVVGLALSPCHHSLVYMLALATRAVDLNFECYVRVMN